MSELDFMKLLGENGFPVVLAAYLLLRIEKKLNILAKHIQEMVQTIRGDEVKRKHEQ